MNRKTTKLPRREFVTVWLLLLTLHALCASYLLAMARLYFFMEQPLMMYVANLLALPEQRRFRLFGTFVGILGGLHAVQLVLHIVSSILARDFVVWPRDAVARRCVELVRGLQPGKTASLATSKAQIHSTAMRALTAIQKALSVQGGHFELLFVLRKAVEVAAQIYQCHKYSTLISRVWINEAFVGMTVTNCLATPLLNHLMLASSSRSQAKVASTGSFNMNTRIPTVRERTLCVAVDVLLTAVSSLVLPLAIFVTWARKFDSTQYTFPTAVLYDDTVYTRLIYENQSIFALSITDSFVKVIPHGSLLLGLSSISFILEKNLTSTEKKFSTTVIKGSSTTPRSDPPRFCSKSRLLQDTVTCFSFVVASAVVLALHIRADNLLTKTNSSVAQMCEQSVRPWFAQNVSCSVVKFNCYRQGVTSPSNNALDSLQRDALASIIFEHCSAFRMPPSIRDFPNLLGLELWNVTLVRWGIEAALDAHLHPKMGYLVMVRVNMTELPEGVLTTSLPNLLSDFEIILANLTKIPDEVAGAWTNAETLYFEHLPLEVFPTVAFRLEASEISLLNNNLKALPDDLFTSDVYPSSYFSLVLSYNSLQSLPALAKKDIAFDELWISHTAITTLPSWTQAAVGELIAGNSPICKDGVAQVRKVVDCSSSESDPLQNGFYPLTFVELSRQL